MIAKTVCTISSSYLCTFIAFSPCGETLRLLGDVADSSPKIFILTECHGSFGRSNHFRKLYFIVSFRFRAQALKNEGGGIICVCVRWWWWW